jgi:uncharacterized membrane protein
MPRMHPTIVKLIPMCSAIPLLIPLSMPIFPDELFTWYAAKQPVEGIIHIAAGDVHPPLYFLLVSSWTVLFGDSIESIRYLSGLLQVATLFVTCRFLNDILECESVTLPQRQMALSLFAIFFGFGLSSFALSHSGRMYALMALLAVSSTHALWASLTERGGAACWIRFTLLSALILWTHNFGIFFVIGQLSWAIGFLLSSNQASSPKSSRLTCAATIIAIAYIPWVFVLSEQVSKVAYDYWIPPLSLSSFANAVIAVFFPMWRVTLTWYESIVVLTIALMAVVPAERRMLLFEKIVITQLGIHILLIVGATIVLGRSIFVPRYLACLLPLVMASVSTRIAMIKWKFGRRCCAVLLGLCIAIAGVNGMVAYARFDKHWETDGLYREWTTAVMDASRNHKACVVTTRPLDYLRVCYYSPKWSATPCFWNPELTAASNRSHIEFYSCISDELIVTDPEKSFRHCNAVIVTEAGAIDGAKLPSQFQFIPAEQFNLDRLWNLNCYAQRSSREDGEVE